MSTITTATEVDGALERVAKLLGLERDELMRQACQRALDMYARGLPVDTAHLEFSRKWVAEHPPLNRPLGTGER